MKYTECFIEQCNSHHRGGNLSKEQMHRMLEIVKYECLLSKTTDDQEKYMFRKKVNELTKRKQPLVLWAEMAAK